MNRTSIELYDGIVTTRSMHRFTDEPIADNVVWDLLKAAQQVPSNGIEPPIAVVVVTDPEQRGRIAEVYRTAFARYEAAARSEAAIGFEPTYGEDRGLSAERYLAEHLDIVPVIVAVYAEVGVHLVADEEGPIQLRTPHAIALRAAQNLVLAARSKALGSTLTPASGLAAGAIAQLLGTPPTHELVALVPIGHPKGDFGRARRRPVYEITHWNRWGERKLSG